MATEQESTLAALKTAIQMEIEGKEYYLQAAEASSNEAGRKLMRQLAAEEDDHRHAFQQIYKEQSQGKPWPETSFQADGGQVLRTIFGRALNASRTGVKAAKTELDAVQTAIDMENRTLDFYREQARSTVNPAEREFYLALAGQESEHARVLLDYYEYLSDPAAYFVATEHPSLDGG